MIYLISIGFWGFMGLMYALMLSMLLVGLIINRKDREALKAYMDGKRSINAALKADANKMGR